MHIYYRIYWDFLGPLLTRAVNLIFSSGNMLAKWTEGIKYMTPESDALCDEVLKWRPRRLLNVVNKIVAKTIVIRLRSILPSIIHDTARYKYFL